MILILAVKKYRIWRGRVPGVVLEKLWEDDDKMTIWCNMSKVTDGWTVVNDDEEKKSYLTTWWC